MKSLTREANGNVVLRSGHFTMRFDRMFGGTPLEWYSEDPYGMLTNAFPGNGTSVYYNTGQDPTQASSNGFLPNPIATGSPDTAMYSYYSSEKLYSPSANTYIVGGFAPDFWLSAEWPDDAIALPANKSDHGWRTLYRPVGLNLDVNPGRPVVFQGTAGNQTGLFFVGNELKLDGGWNQRIRSYGARRLAAKITVSLNGADADSSAGIYFGLNVTDGCISKEKALALDHTRLVFYRKTNTWELSSLVKGKRTIHKQGVLSRTQAQKLKSSAGLQMEIRTHNYIPSKLYVLLDNTNTLDFDWAAFPLGPHFALYACSKSGKVTFSNRQIFDVGVEFTSEYYATPGEDGKITSRIKLWTIGGNRFFYRTNLPGLYINPTTFPDTDKVFQGLTDKGWVPLPSMPFLLSDYKKYWAGNAAGTLGICAEVVSALVDSRCSSGAHALISNQNFMLNSLSQVGETINNTELTTVWSTRRE